MIIDANQIFSQYNICMNNIEYVRGNNYKINANDAKYNIKSNENL